MVKPPLPLTPEGVRVLVRCPLHYHFLQASDMEQAGQPEPAQPDSLVRERIQELHAAGGPARRSLEECLQGMTDQPLARKMVEHYYLRLKTEWPQMIAGNETMELRISLGGVPLALSGTADRLDKAADGGIVAVLFQTGAGPAPTPADLREDYAVTVYHALVAAAYPLKRPVRIRQIWLQDDKSVEVELSEAEYRRNLGYIREPIQALARGQFRARPGLHCDVCPFQYQGCPVYAHEVRDPGEGNEFAPSLAPSKIPQRKWIFKT